MLCPVSLLWQSMIKGIKEKMNNSTKPKRRETYTLTGFKNLPTSRSIVNA